MDADRHLQRSRRRRAGGFYASGKRGDANPPPGRTGLLYTHPPVAGVPAKIEQQVHLGGAQRGVALRLILFVPAALWLATVLGRR
jgi:hypothetical protein